MFQCIFSKSKTIFLYNHDTATNVSKYGSDNILPNLPSYSPILPIYKDFYSICKHVCVFFFPCTIECSLGSSIALSCHVFLFFLIWNNSQAFLFLLWHWHFWRLWSLFKVEHSSLWVYVCFVMISFRLCTPSQNTTQKWHGILFSVWHPETCNFYLPPIYNVNFNQVAWFFHYIDTIMFPCF